MVATSGSTGRPKGTELSAAALLASARASLRRIGAAAGQRWLACLPAFHVAGLQVLIRSLLAGAEPVYCDRLGPDIIAASGCAYVSVVPTQLRRLTEAGADLSKLRAILLGGAPAQPGLVAAATAAGGRVITTYGMSETCGGCVYDGIPLDRVRLGIGADSRIRIAGPVLFSGYRLRPDLTAEATDGAWFITSDLGSVGPDGLLTVRGRADDVITTGGEKVLAADVEAALGAPPWRQGSRRRRSTRPGLGRAGHRHRGGGRPGRAARPGADPRARAGHPGRARRAAGTPGGSADTAAAIRQAGSRGTAYPGILS